MKPKNIVILMSDEQRWDTLNSLSSERSVTPNIDALAAQGISLDRSYTAYPLCCPARASLWTGLMPHGHEVTGNWKSIREDLQDEGLISNFKEAGYHTIYTGKWHVPGTTPQRFHFDDVSAIPAVIEGRDRGRFIEEYREYTQTHGYKLHETHIENLTHSDIGQLKREGKAPYGTAEIKEEHFLETWQTDIFTEALDRRPDDRPFFAVCSYNAPHFPMIVPAPYDTLIKPDEVKLPINFLQGTDGKPFEVLQSSYFSELNGLDDNEWRSYIAHYLGLCALIDKQVGIVVDYLKREELYEDTLIVFLSDHGDMMGSHGLIKKGFPLHYEEALRVPLILTGTGEDYPSPARSNALVSLIDLLPTLAELTGVNIKQKHEGRSFVPLLQGQTSTHRDYVLAETFKIGGSESAVVGGERGGPEQFNVNTDSVNFSIRTSAYKYVFRYRDIEELYNLEMDAGENMNIAASPSSRETLKQLRGLLLQELKEANPFLHEIVANKLIQRGVLEGFAT
ncbi:sulfatase-like hydrolase/transferase [Paenibacillus sp. LjRoot56]|uniref:sulfatase-like hydrolase/transferase n=1 Tax=Paenibacillus sp. LjRoot56 TaxID=3342333 RepID=UPI003ED0C698